MLVTGLLDEGNSIRVGFDDLRDDRRDVCMHHHNYDCQIPWFEVHG